jgi:multiple sugar transport system permease protein
MPLIVPAILANTFGTFLLRQFFMTLPAELEEAALVDGCSRMQALRKVAWPLAAPGIVSAAAFAFIFSWTEFLFAQVLARDEAVTVPVALAGMITSFQGNLYGQASALTMVSLVPAVLLGILVQRHLVRGLTLGAVQG